MTWFSKDYNQFFKELAANNTKEWFDANRKRYEKSVKEPFKVFVTAVIKQVHTHDKGVNIEPKDAIFRINRDIRFATDKTPYKLNLSAIVSPGGRKDMTAAGIYFELGPENVKIYGGAYMPDKDQLIKIRTAIMDDHKGFRKALDGKAFKTLFGNVQGEKNKVVPKEFKAFLEKEPLIANKQFYVGAELPSKWVTDPKLMEKLMEHYIAMKPYNDWLVGAMK